MTDKEADRCLLADIQRGDQAALAALYDKYVPRMLAVAMGILRQRSDAEDLIHDVFVEAWQNAASYNPQRGTVYSWLLVRVRSRAIDRLRSLQVAQRHAMLQKPLDEQSRATADDAARASDGSLARDALLRLSQVQRQVVELSYFRGLSCSEIATRCGLPIGTVKSRLSSALARLRRELNPDAEVSR